VPGAVDDPLVEIIGHLGAVIMQIEKNHDRSFSRALQPLTSWLFGCSGTPPRREETMRLGRPR
jgi:hypothetical protein